MTGVVLPKPLFSVRKDRNGQWYWTLQSRNGMYIAQSTYPYTRRRDCVRAIDAVLIAIFDANVEIES